MAINRIHFQSIPVADQDRALDFYVKNLGFEVHTDAPYEEGWRWIFLTLPGADTRLHFATPDDMIIKNKPALCLVCDSVDDEAVKLQKKRCRDHERARRRALGARRSLADAARHRRQSHLAGKFQGELSHG